MTEFVLPPIVVDYDADWIDVDLRGDLGDWVRRTARDILSRMPGHHNRRAEKHMVSVLEAAGAIARKPQPVNGTSNRAVHVAGAELFTPLREVDIGVTEEQFANAPELTQAHPRVQSDSPGHR